MQDFLICLCVSALYISSVPPEAKSPWLVITNNVIVFICGAGTLVFYNKWRESRKKIRQGGSGEGKLPAS